MLRYSKGSRHSTDKKLCTSWWVHPICAVRDGAIGSTGRVTASEQGVHAIILTGSDAVDVGEDTILCEWNTKDQEEEDVIDVRKLLKNVISGEPVRVLRTSKLESNLAPSAGVRYDGL